MTGDVRRRLDTALGFGRSIVRVIREDQITFMARSVAYSAFVSLFPLVLLLVVVATLIGGESLASNVLALTESSLTPTAQTTLTSSLTRAGDAFSFSILGVVTLVWGVLNVFRGLDTAFSTLYEESSDGGLLDQVKDGLIVLGAITVAVVTVVGVGVAVALVPTVPFLDLFGSLFLVVGLTVAFLPMYYVFPDVDVTVREVLPGTVAAAIGWALLQELFGVYVAVAGGNDLYGAIGGVILLVTWLYFGALVLLVGAAANVVLSDRVRQSPPPS